MNVTEKILIPSEKVLEKDLLKDERHIIIDREFFKHFKRYCGQEQTAFELANSVIKASKSAVTTDDGEWMHYILQAAMYERMDHYVDMIVKDKEFRSHVKGITLIFLEAFREITIDELQF